MTLHKPALKSMFCALLVSLSSPGALKATTIIHVPFDEMVRSSGLIVKGTVIEMHQEVRPGRGEAPPLHREKTGVPPLARPEADDPAGARSAPVSAGLGSEGGPYPFTHITFLVERAIKGAPSTRTLKLRMPGGTIGNLRFEIVGLPRFEVGASYYLFLRPDHDSVSNFIVGVDQGFFRVESDAITRAELLRGAGGQIVAGVEKNEMVWRTGAGRRAATLTTDGLTSLVRSVTGWDRRPAPPEPEGRP